MNWSSKMWLAAIGIVGVTAAVVTGHADVNVLAAYLVGLGLEVPSIPETPSGN